MTSIRSSAQRTLGSARAWVSAARVGVGEVRRRARLRSHALALEALVFITLAATVGLKPVLALAAFMIVAAATIASHAETDSGEGDDSSDAAWDDARKGPTREREGESWRALVDALPDAAVALDGNGTIIHHNAHVLEIFPKARAGQPLSHMSRNPALNAAVDKAYAMTEPVVVELFERVPVERRISATISRLAGGRRRSLPVLLVTFHDLTEQDRLAQMRADFIANASHELRTPLASLKGFVETLQGPARDDPISRDKFLGIMASQAARMTRLIDDLLSLSRVEMRAHLPPKGIVDLNETAAFVAQTLEPLARGQKMTILLRKLDTPARIRGDREEIVQVLQNLVHNAIKYGRENGHVEIAVSRVVDGTPPVQRLMIAVADDGPGIAPEHLPRLTERFYRANVAASRDKGGTGLGLAIVKHIVVRHRAELRIASEIGRGSTFSVLFDEFTGVRAS